MSVVKVPKIFISAGELSSDRHAAELVKAIRQIRPDVEFLGVVGPYLRMEGVRKVISSEALLVMGFMEVLWHLPRIHRLLNQVAAVIQQERPDILVVLDYPGFHFRLIQKIHFIGVPVVYYIPPKIWIWKKHRIYFFKRFVQKVLCIFPFEKEIYDQANVPCRYVGNPLQDELPLQLSTSQARKKLEIDTTDWHPARDRVLCLMPGSRPAELSYHWDLFLHATGALLADSNTDQRLYLLIPLAASADVLHLQERFERWQASLNEAQRQRLLGAQVLKAQAAIALRAADAACVKSGTSTLEAFLLRCPHLVVYRVSRISYWIYRVFVQNRAPVALSNWIQGWRDRRPWLFKELIGSQISVEEMQRELSRLLQLPKKEEFFSQNPPQYAILQQESPSVLAAQEVLSFLGSTPSHR